MEQYLDPGYLVQSTTGYLLASWAVMSLFAVRSNEFGHHERKYMVLWSQRFGMKHLIGCNEAGKDYGDTVSPCRGYL